MTVQYKSEKERTYNECTVTVSKEVKNLVDRWRINLTLVAGHMNMRPQTLHNKYKGHNDTKFSVQEYQRFINVLKNMASDFKQVLNKYPLIDE